MTCSKFDMKYFFPVANVFYFYFLSETYLTNIVKYGQSSSNTALAYQLCILE